jgi:hypothetical protein
MRTDSNRGGVTTFQVVTLVVCVGLLVTLMLPISALRWRICNMTPQTICANNQKGIAGTWLAAMQDAPISTWQRLAKRKLAGCSDLSPDQLDALRIHPNQFALVTVALFEVWSVQQELPMKLFECPGRTDRWYWKMPDLAPSLKRSDTSWGWNATQRISYAFDYSAPADAPEKRIICADREPGGHSTGTLFKERCVIVAHSDGSTAKLPCVPRDAASPASAPCTQGYAGPVDHWLAISEVVGDDPTLPPDNIYDALGDLPATAKPGDEFQVGTGSPRRAFVK